MRAKSGGEFSITSAIEIWGKLSWECITAISVPQCPSRSCGSRIVAVLVVESRIVAVLVVES